MLPSDTPRYRPAPKHAPDQLPASVEVLRHQVDLHGQRISYLSTDREHAFAQRPVVVLVHGLAGRAQGWLPLIAPLAQHAGIIAPDLLGHGDSVAPHRGDYTPGAHACRLRDLLESLGHRRVHLVGHSFGGGVAMSFAYQFPERISSLTLISSGGLGHELGRALRAASLPGVALAAGLLATFTPGWLARLARRGAITLGVAGDAELAALARLLGTLATEQRYALVDTLRGVANWSGQRMDATDRLHTFASLPCLLVTGRYDRCIPYQHATRAHGVLPHSILKVLPTGHFPHHEQPEQLSRLIIELIAGSHPATSLSTVVGSLAASLSCTAAGEAGSR
jgi:pimeloyl-ACP methyl ester carboxylesterase